MKKLLKIFCIIAISYISLIFTAPAWCVTDEQWIDLSDRFLVENGPKISQSESNSPRETTPIIHRRHSIDNLVDLLRLSGLTPPSSLIEKSRSSLDLLRQPRQLEEGVVGSIGSSDKEMINAVKTFDEFKQKTREKQVTEDQLYSLIEVSEPSLTLYIDSINAFINNPQQIPNCFAQVLFHLAVHMRLANMDTFMTYIVRISNHIKVISANKDYPACPINNLIKELREIQKIGESCTSLTREQKDNLIKEQIEGLIAQLQERYNSIPPTQSTVAVEEETPPNKEYFRLLNVLRPSPNRIKIGTPRGKDAAAASPVRQPEQLLKDVPPEAPTTLPATAASPIQQQEQNPTKNSSPISPNEPSPIVGNGDQTVQPDITLGTDTPPSMWLYMRRMGRAISAIFVGTQQPQNNSATSEEIGSLAPMPQPPEEIGSLAPMPPPSAAQPEERKEEESVNRTGMPAVLTVPSTGQNWFGFIRNTISEA